MFINPPVILVESVKFRSTSRYWARLRPSVCVLLAVALTFALDFVVRGPQDFESPRARFVDLAPQAHAVRANPAGHRLESGRQRVVVELSSALVCSTSLIPETGRAIASGEHCPLKLSETLTVQTGRSPPLSIS